MEQARGRDTILPKPATLPRLRLLGPCALLIALLTSGCAIPQWPVEGPMTSAFGMRFMGVLPSVHHGVDLRVPTGTPVRSALPGTVRWAGVMGGYGNVVWIDHSRGVITVYAHLDRISVRSGDRVSGGQEIGLSGATGDVTGPHLHFEVWKGGRPVDPVGFLGTRP